MTGGIVCVLVFSLGWFLGRKSAKQDLEMVQVEGRLLRALESLAGKREKKEEAPAPEIPSQAELLKMDPAELLHKYGGPGLVKALEKPFSCPICGVIKGCSPTRLDKDGAHSYAMPWHTDFDGLQCRGGSMLLEP